MANEVSFGWVTGEAAMTFGLYTSAGVERESGTAMTETPAASGLYLGTPTTIETGDYVIVSNGGGVIGFGQYEPDVSLTADLESQLDDIETALNKTTVVVDETDDGLDGDGETVLVGGPTHC